MEVLGIRSCAVAEEAQQSAGFCAPDPGPTGRYLGGGLRISLQRVPGVRAGDAWVWHP